MTRLTSLVLVLALASAGCGDDPGPTTPSPPIQNVSETYLAGLAVGGSSFYSFVVTETVLVHVTYASAVDAVAGPPINAPFVLGIGIPQGVGCQAFETKTATPSLAPQLSRTLEPGTYCVSVKDGGGISTNVEFLVRITQNPTPRTTGGSTDVFASTLPLKGNATRFFTTSQAGTIQLTLQSAGNNNVVGVGIGMPRGDGITCNLTQAVNTAGGGSPQLSLSAEVGQYCVRVYDLGTLASDIPFSLQIIRP